MESLLIKISPIPSLSGLSITINESGIGMPIAASLALFTGFNAASGEDSVSPYP